MTFRNLQTSLSMSSDAPEEFNPRRLTLIRERKGLSKSELAEAIDVDLRTIVAYESGEFCPSPETRRRLEMVLGFPASFFQGSDLERPRPDVASFRSLSRLKPMRRDMALAQGAIALYLNDWLESKFELPTADLPDLGRERSPETAAAAIRQIWGIGEMPIRNIVHLLEAQGIRVFSLAIDTREVDAFSMWRENTPFVFLNNNKSSERSRYDAAHELGHLLLHRHSSPQGREAEREADIFAGAFLMPKASVIARSPRFAVIDDLIRLKRIWNVSVAALNYRLHEVGMMSEWQYRTLSIQIAKRGYRTFEPDSAPRETSQLLPTMLSELYREGITRGALARALHLPPSELEEYMFGLTMTSIEGKGQDTSNRGKRPNLSLVKK
ncbi:MAG TPA: XRE family transcriptional regulator [Terriglobales bacterium]|nr:XRE family transcriptional regulator [Terriglobales bacterium]